MAALPGIEELQKRIDALQLELEGDETRAERNDFQPPSLSGRVDRIAYDQWDTTQAPTKTHERAYGWAAEAFEKVLAELRAVAADLGGLEDRAEAAGVPWTPGRLPTWSPGG